MEFEKQIEEALAKQPNLGNKKVDTVELQKAQGMAENYNNAQDVEMAWAMKAGKHAETYFNLISSLDSRKLRLTKIDDEIYEDFRKTFGDFEVKLIDEDVLKGHSSKETWRNFCNRYEHKVTDFNYGTMLRLDATKDYDQHNSTCVPRVQFYAIEIARNKEGANMDVCKFAVDEKAKAAEEAFEKAEKGEE